MANVDALPDLMPASKRSPLFVAALLVLALVATGEACCIAERFTAARAAGKKLAQKRDALAALAAAAPAPSRETAAQIESDLARAQRVLASLQAGLRGHGPATERLHSASPPVARTDAFFDLATFIENARHRARQHGVTFSPAAAHFGFSLYAHEAPEPALIAAVFRQRLVVQYLVDALLDARPRSLLSVQRERPVSADERRARVASVETSETAEPLAGGDSAAPSPDYCEPNRRIGARAPGAVETTGYRLVFTGQTTALRAFLNKLATFELPLIVRAVEVEPASGDEATTLSDIAEETTPMPASVVLTANSSPKPGPLPVAALVPRSFSKFSVTVDFIDLVSAAATTPPAS